MNPPNSGAGSRPVKPLDQLGINESTLYRLCRKGKIAHYRIGAGAGKISLTQQNIDDYLSAAMVPVRSADQEELKPGLQIPSKWIRPQGARRA